MKTFTSHEIIYGRAIIGASKFWRRSGDLCRFLNSEDVQEMQQLRRVIRETAPNAKEKISYKCQRLS